MVIEILGDEIVERTTKGRNKRKGGKPAHHKSRIEKAFG